MKKAKPLPLRELVFCPPTGFVSVHSRTRGALTVAYALTRELMQQGFVLSPVIIDCAASRNRQHYEVCGVTPSRWVDPVYWESTHAALEELMKRNQPRLVVVKDYASVWRHSSGFTDALVKAVEATRSTVIFPFNGIASVPLERPLGGRFGPIPVTELTVEGQFGGFLVHSAWGSYYLSDTTSEVV